MFGFIRRSFGAWGRRAPRPAQFGSILLLAALGAALVQRDDGAWAARRTPRWPIALKGSLYVKHEKSLEQREANEVHTERWEDTVAVQDVVVYIQSASSRPHYDTWFNLTGREIPQTGKMALVMLQRYEDQFTEYGQPCTDTYTLEAALEDVPVDSDSGSGALMWVERQLSPGLWQVFVRATAPVTASETWTSTCHSTPLPGARNVDVDATVQGTLKSVRRGRRNGFVLRGERIYQGSNDPYTHKEELAGTLFPVSTRRR